MVSIKIKKGATIYDHPQPAASKRSYQLIFDTFKRTPQLQRGRGDRGFFENGDGFLQAEARLIPARILRLAGEHQARRLPLSG